MKQKLILITLILSLSISLFGCIKDSYTPSTTTTTSISTTTSTSASTTTTTLITTGNITGIIDLDGSLNDSGATVAIDSTTLNATSASNGSFTISDVPTGTYSLTISKSGYTTRTTTNITVQSGQQTTLNTIALYPEYDMSSLSGTILSMTGYLGYFYIATDQNLYKIPTSDLTNISTSTPNTNSLTSLCAALMSMGGSPSADYLAGFYTTASSFNMFISDLSLNTIYTMDTGDVVFSAVTFATSPIGYFYDNNKFVKVDFSNGNTSATVNVTESGIVSLDYNNGHFYACNSTTIYKYNDTTFSSPSSLVGTSIGLGSDLIGIACDGTYIWVIDKTTEKLYRIPESLL